MDGDETYVIIDPLAERHGLGVAGAFILCTVFENASCSDAAIYLLFRPVHLAGLFWSYHAFILHLSYTSRVNASQVVNWQERSGPLRRVGDSADMPS